MEHCQLCFSKMRLPSSYRGSSQTREQNVEAGVGMRTREVLALRLLNKGDPERAENKALTVTETTRKAGPRLGDQAWGSDQMDQWVQKEDAESAGGL